MYYLHDEELGQYNGLMLDGGYRGWRWLTPQHKERGIAHLTSEGSDDDERMKKKKRKMMMI